MDKTEYRVIIKLHVLRRTTTGTG